MSIDNISKDSIEAIMLPLIDTQLKDSKVLDKIKSNAAQYGKLQLLVQQAQLLKVQISNVINETLINTDLHQVKCNFTKVSGNTYHLYKKDMERYYFSILSPNDWNNKPPHDFVASYYFDYDKSFKLLG